MSAELWAAIAAELIKVRRAVMLWATVVAFVVAACVGAFFMFVLQDPARHGHSACWAPRRSSVAAPPTGPATSRWSRRWSRSAGCSCSG